jgi:hypothetical protein
MTIYRATGDKKYLEPIPRALAYLKRSTLPDGRLARYYELKTNKPLYMSRRGDDYSLTYDDSDLPDHYGWKVASRLDSIEREYRQLLAADDKAAAAKAFSAQEIRQIIDALDAEGRWISTYAGERLVGQPKFKAGDRYIGSDVFSRNVEALGAYLRAAR